MPRLMIFLCTVLCMALAAAAPSLAVSETVDEVRACMEANQPKNSLVQQYAMESVDRVGSKRTNEGKTYWKRDGAGAGSRALVRVNGPPEVRGTAVLMLHDGERTDIFSYLPEIGRVRRINERSASGSFLGSDFTYADFERLQGFADDTSAKLLPAQEVEGHAAYVVEGRPQHGETSEYSRVVSYVDQETCIAVRAEAYDQRERLLKVFTTPRDRITQQDERWIPQHVLVVNEQTGTRTTLEIDEVELDPEVPDKYFSQGSFYRGR